MANGTAEDYVEVSGALFNYFRSKGYQVHGEGLTISISNGKDTLDVEMSAEPIDTINMPNGKQTTTTKLGMTFTSASDTDPAFCERVIADYKYFFEHLTKP